MSRKEGILEMMRATKEMAESLGTSAPVALASPDLTRSNAEELLEICVRFLAGLGLLFAAIEDADEDDDADDELLEEASEFADASHELGMALQMKAFEQVKRLGGNANRLLEEAQKRYY